MFSFSGCDMLRILANPLEASCIKKNDKYKYNFDFVQQQLIRQNTKTPKQSNQPNNEDLWEFL